ncbi:MAG: hypothetical protein ACE37K_08750 [Planctomycetota bacterium]
MDVNKSLLIARYSARYSVRGGVGLVFLLLSLTFGLIVAHTMLSPVEMMTNQVMEHDPDASRDEIRADVLERLMRQARQPVAWLLSAPESGDPDVDRANADEADAWADYLLEERPSILSAIFMILLFGWPLIVAFGAFDLYAGDISSRQLRYQLLRADRTSIFVGRLLGMLITFALVLLMLGVTISGYLALKLPLYDGGAVVSWTLYSMLALAVATLPYVGLCSWISASIGSAFGSLTIVSLIIGGVPLLAMIARNTYEPAQYINYVLPWGFQTRLFHNEPSQVALAATGCVAQAALFFWLGHRKFVRRDL